MRDLLAYLGPQICNDGVVLAEVPFFQGAPLLDGLSDLDFQGFVGLLQTPHRLQVAGQAVVQMLHGDLLVSNGRGTSSCPGRLVVKTPTEAAANPGAIGDGGDPGPVAPCTTADTVGIWLVHLQRSASITGVPREPGEISRMRFQGSDQGLHVGKTCTDQLEVKAYRTEEPTAESGGDERWFGLFIHNAEHQNSFLPLLSYLYGIFIFITFAQTLSPLDCSKANRCADKFIFTLCNKETVWQLKRKNRGTIIDRHDSYFTFSIKSLKQPTHDWLT